MFVQQQCEVFFFFQNDLSTVAAYFSPHRGAHQSIHLPQHLFCSSLQNYLLCFCCSSQTNQCCQLSVSIPLQITAKTGNQLLGVFVIKKFQKLKTLVINFFNVIILELEKMSNADEFAFVFKVILFTEGSNNEGKSGSDVHDCAARLLTEAILISSRYQHYIDHRSCTKKGKGIHLLIDVKPPLSKIKRVIIEIKFAEQVYIFLSKWRLPRLELRHRLRNFPTNLLHRLFDNPDPKILSVLSSSSSRDNDPHIVGLRRVAVRGVTDSC